MDVNSVDSEKNKNSLLHWAASYGDEATLAILIEGGAAVNAVDKDGIAPLHDALKRKSESLAGILVKAGAYLNLTATSG